MTCVGIDLGTSYCCAGIWKNDRVEILMNEEGDFKTPSYVSFYDTEHLVGEGAKNLAATNADNVVFSAKRLVGRRYDEKFVKRTIKNKPYNVVELPDGRPAIEVSHLGQTRQMSPIDVTVLLLAKIKKLVQDNIGEAAIGSVVISVPAHYTMAQREATKEAALQCGLPVSRLISDTSASALAYTYNKYKDAATDKATPANVLVFDCGGGSTTASVYLIEDGVVEAKATAGNPYLGGEDMDFAIVKYFTRLIARNFGIHLMDSSDSWHSSHKAALLRLQAASERAKHTLSTHTEAVIDLPDLLPGVDFTAVLTRAQLDIILHHHLQRCLLPIRNALAAAHVAPIDVTDVVMVGGASRVPHLQRLVKDFFLWNANVVHVDPEVTAGLNPEECVALGATLQAALMTASFRDQAAASPERQLLDSLLVVEANPHTLGVRTAGGLMVPVLRQGSSIPTKKTIHLTTSRDNQTEGNIDVYEGGNLLSSHNRFVGSFALSGINSQPRGHATIEVTFELDVNDTLTVHAVNQETGESADLPRVHSAVPLAADHPSDLILKEHSEKSAEEVRQEVEAAVKAAEAEKELDTAREELDDEVDRVAAYGSELTALSSAMHSWVYSLEGLEATPAVLHKKRQQLLAVTNERLHHFSSEVTVSAAIATAYVAEDNSSKVSDA